MAASTLRDGAAKFCAPAKHANRSQSVAAPRTDCVAVILPPLPVARPAAAAAGTQRPRAHKPTTDGPEERERAAEWSRWQSARNSCNLQRVRVLYEGVRKSTVRSLAALCTSCTVRAAHNKRNQQQQQQRRQLDRPMRRPAMMRLVDVVLCNARVKTKTKKKARAR